MTRLSSLVYDATLILTSFAFGVGTLCHRRDFGWRLAVYAAVVSILFRTYRLSLVARRVIGEEEELRSHPLFVHDMTVACVTLATGTCFAETRVSACLAASLLCFASAWHKDLATNRLRHVAGHLCAVLAAWQ